MRDSVKKKKKPEWEKREGHTKSAKRLGEAGRVEERKSTNYVKRDDAGLHWMNSFLWPMDNCLPTQ